jgi:arsenate reductase-like glutaredoxin family protein
MKKFYYLATCDTCKRMMKELQLTDFILREIKSAPISPDELDHMASLAGSFEAIFSRRSRNYRSRGFHERTLSEPEYRDAILSDYTFLKRPVMVSGTHVVAGNSPEALAEMKRGL